MLSSVFPMLPYGNKKETQLKETPGGRGPSKIYKAYGRCCQNLLFYQSGIKTRIQIHHSEDVIFSHFHSRGRHDSTMISNEQLLKFISIIILSKCIAILVPRSYGRWETKIDNH